MLKKNIKIILIQEPFLKSILLEFTIIFLEIKMNFHLPWVPKVIPLSIRSTCLILTLEVLILKLICRIFLKFHFLYLFDSFFFYPQNVEELHRNEKKDLSLFMVCSTYVLKNQIMLIRRLFRNYVCLISTLYSCTIYFSG